MAAIAMGGRRVRSGGKVLGYTAITAAAVSSAVASTMGAASPLGWWDGTIANGLMVAGGTATQFGGAAVTGVVNQVAAGPALVAGQVPGGTSVAITGTSVQRGVPHVNGLLAGVARINPDVSVNPYGLAWPILGQADALQTAAPVALPPGSAWWLAVAWTRPNVKQRDLNSIRPQTDPVVIVAHGNTTVLSMDNTYRATATGADTGGMYVLGTKISSTVPLRYCGTALLVNVPGVGVSVYLNSSTTATATGIACSTSASALLTLMADPSDLYFGSSQCYFHEAAYGGALSAAQQTAVLNSLSRFSTGQRQALLLVPEGQSNLGFVPGTAFDAARQAIAYYGAFVSVDWSAGAAAPGQPLYLPAASGSTTSQTYLTDAGVGTDPSTWTKGDTGTTQNNALSTSLAPIFQPDVGFAFSYYSEAITTGGTSRPTYALGFSTFVAAYRRYIGILRATVSATAARMPFGAMRGIGYQASQPELLAMISDGFEQLSADVQFNGATVIYNGWDSNGRGGTSGSTGDTSHVTDTDHIVAFRRAAGPIIRKLTARGALALPAAGLPGGIAITGPRITLAQFVDVTGATVSSTPTQYVKVTVTHDTGTALTLPGAANTGPGWSMHDGWSGVGARGTSILATACTIMSATTLLVTFASVPASVRTSCQLTYCDGGRIGTGNAASDNASSVSPVANFGIAFDLGPAFTVDYPLPSTPSGIALS